MRLVSVLSVVFVLSVSGSGFAQEWSEYINRDDLFTVHLPTKPKVETITYTSEFNGELPARLYTAEDSLGRYSLTVVDFYTNIEQIAAERVKTCPPGNEPCRGGPVIGWGYWRIELRGALVWASWKYLQKDVKLIHYMWNNVDLVEGHEMTVVSNVDRSKSYVSIYLLTKAASISSTRPCRMERRLLDCCTHPCASSTPKAILFAIRASTRRVMPCPPAPGSRASRARPGRRRISRRNEPRTCGRVGPRCTRLRRGWARRATVTRLCARGWLFTVASLSLAQPAWSQWLCRTATASRSSSGPAPAVTASRSWRARITGSGRRSVRARTARNGGGSSNS